MKTNSLNVETHICVSIFRKNTRKKVMRTKMKKSTWITLALLIYVTVTAILLLPRNTETSVTEKYVTVIAGYVIVVVLWFVLRKKEQLQQKRREEMNKQEKDQ